MIEVLHLIDTYRIGGPGKTIINSARFIDRDRFRVHVASFTHQDASRNEFARAVTAAGIPSIELLETRRVDPAHVKALRAYIRDQKIRILHTHGYRSDLFGALVRWGLPVAVVTTHHGWIRNNPRQTLMTRLALQLARAFDGVEVVSSKLLEELPSSVRRSSRVAVVHNAVVMEDYEPAGRRAATRARLGLGEDISLIGVIGRLSPEKGCLDVLEAFARIASAVPRAHLALAGEGPLEAEMRARATALAIPHRVSFVGHQNPVQPFYEALDLMISPSHTEGLSNVILEALTAGCPVVATDVGGNGEIIEVGVSGMLVPARAVEALAAAAIAVLQDHDLRVRLSREGHRRVAEAFSFNVRMRKEEAFYDRMLEEFVT